ncbi:hypothetical protein ACWGE1_02365 [Streptomyces sp. NPDC054932]
MEVVMRAVFDPAEQGALRADARETADSDPQVAHVLERLAGEGVALDHVTAREDPRKIPGRLPLGDSAPIPNVA